MKNVLGRVGLSLFFVLFVLTMEVSADILPFEDVPLENSYYHSIEYLYEKGIVNGKTSNIFDPDGIVSIGEFSVVLDRLNNTNDDLEIEVENNHWACKSAMKLTEKYGKKEIDYTINGLNSAITKEIAIKILLREFNIEMLISDYVLENPFEDVIVKAVLDNSDYIINAYYLGIIEKGIDNKFNPKGFLTRGELCDIIVKMLNKVENGVIAPPEIDIIKDLNVEYKGENTKSHMTGIISALNKFSPELIEDLKKDIKIIVTSENQNKYVDVGVEALGLYEPDKNRIVLFTNGMVNSLMFSVDRTLRHEIGHYIWDELLTEEERNVFRNSFKSEDIEKFSDIINRDYCKANVGEYFAEWVSNYALGFYQNKLKELNLFDIFAILDKYVIIETVNE